MDRATASGTSIGSIDTRKISLCFEPWAARLGDSPFHVRLEDFWHFSSRVPEWMKPTTLDPNINNDDANLSFCKHLFSWTINWCYVVFLLLFTFIHRTRLDAKLTFSHWPEQWGCEASKRSKDNDKHRRRWQHTWTNSINLWTRINSSSKGNIASLKSSDKHWPIA